MSTITRYVTVSPEDVESDHEFKAFAEAKREAQRLGHAVIERTYVYDDSALVWTPDGRDVWPPQAEDDAEGEASVHTPRTEQ